MYNIKNMVSYKCLLQRKRDWLGDNDETGHRECAEKSESSLAISIVRTERILFLFCSYRA